MYYAAPYLIALGRVLMAVMFIQAGIGKIFGYAGAQGYMEAAGVPGAAPAAGHPAEVGGGLGVLLGLFTRWSALLLAGFCVLAAHHVPPSSRRPDADDQLHEEHHHRRRLPRARWRRQARSRSTTATAERNRPGRLSGHTSMPGVSKQVLVIPALARPLHFAAFPLHPGQRNTFCQNPGPGAMGYKVAVVGATGNVGREMLNILAEREFPADEVFAIASRRSMGVEVSFGDQTLKCRDLEQFDFRGVDICLMSAGSAVSKEWSPKIGAKGCIVIDNSSCWRYDQDVPLVVPEVNADAMAGFTKKNIIANPNCSTAQLVVVLKPLHDAAKIKRVVVATYQSVSGAGKEAMDELWNQTKGMFVTEPHRAARSSPSRSPSTSFPISTSSWMTATPRRNGR